MENEIVTWNVLLKYNCSYVYHKFPREKNVIEKYAYDCRNGTSKKNLESILDIIKINKYCFAENIYPYYLMKNIKHYVFWFYEIDISMEECLELSKIYFKTKNIVVFCNSPELKSVPNINHYHIFIKN